MSVLKIKDNNNQWVEIPAGGVGVPSGGNTGDILVKTGASDYATGWSDGYAHGVIYLTNVPCSAMTGDFASVSNQYITSSHYVAECVFANPSYITSNVSWTTASGSLKLNGTCSAATTCNIVLVGPSDWSSAPIEFKHITKKFDNLSQYSGGTYYKNITNIHTALSLPANAKILSASLAGWSGLGANAVSVGYTEVDTVYLTYTNNTTIGSSSYVTIYFVYVET